MKATGIVRRIDDLGRVVIPKEIRRTLRIREGDPLEIYTGGGGEVVFKKYSAMGELSDSVCEYAEALSQSTELGVLICDRDHCVAAAGVPKKEMLERRITAELEEIMESRKSFLPSKDDGKCAALEGVDRSISAAFPIISSGDVTGAVVFIESGENTAATDTEIKLGRVAAQFLGNSVRI